MVKITVERKGSKLGGLNVAQIINFSMDALSAGVVTKTVIEDESKPNLRTLICIRNPEAFKKLCVKYFPKYLVVEDDRPD